jgi:excisionase family DNA binding protein
MDTPDLIASTPAGHEDPALVLYTPREAAEILRCDVGLVYDLAKRRRLGHMRRGRNILVSKLNLLEYQAKATVPALDEDQAEALN